MRRVSTESTAPKRAGGRPGLGSAKLLLQQGVLRRPVATFLVTAVLLAVCLRALDQLMFSEEDPGMSDLCAFAAFAIGVVFFTRPQQRMPKVRRAEAVKLPQGVVRPGSGRVGKHESRSEDVLPYEPDDSRIEEIVAACKKGELALAEARLAQLLKARTAGIKKPTDESIKETSASRFSRQMQIVLQACIHAGDAERAAAWTYMLLSAGAQPTSDMLHSVVQSLIEFGEQNKVAALMAKAISANISLDVKCLQLLFKYCVSPNDDDALEEWISRLAAHSHEDHFNCLLAVLRVETHTSSVDRVDHWMSRAIQADAAQGADIYNAAICACVRLGELWHAQRWLRNMKEAAMKMRNLSPDQVSYGAMIAGFAQQGEHAQAEEWLRQMVAAGLRPTAATFNSVIRVYANNEDLSNLARWMSLSQEYDVQLREQSYNLAIAATVHAGQTEAAERWLRQCVEMESPIQNKACYNSVVNAFAKTGDAEGAQRIVTLMCEQAIEPDVVTLGAAVHAAAKSGNQEKAEAMFDLIITRGKTRPDAIGFNALINASVKAGDAKRAEFWLRKMIEVGVEPSVVSYTTMLHAHARCGDIAAAEEGLERMRKNGIEANVVSYTALIHACVKAGDIPRAEKWFEEMRGAGIQANAVSYSSLLNVCAKAGDYQRAERWLEQMCEDGVLPTEVCYNNVIDACAKADCPERAEYWLRRLTGDEASDAFSTSGMSLAPTRQSFTAAAQAYARHGAFKEVERLMGQMEDYGISMDEFCITVQLSSYARARPRQKDLAELSFRRYCKRGLPITKPPMHVLKSVLGAPRFATLLEELHIRLPSLAESQGEAKFVCTSRTAPACRGQNMNSLGDRLNRSPTKSSPTLLTSRATLKEAQVTRCSGHKHQKARWPSGR
eukprot:TRINITY_DN4452_c0_g2_i1.p1 TRINITY_DN4452_c0_g2~~TRINITY_DN4452_c0_g2_i1.p1  ORF type:complete len:894 (+),score=177.77 TRINITY_DN4452_c0_g2_i1:108-2789(+)